MKDVVRLSLPPTTDSTLAGGAWLAALRGYLGISGALNLSWETVQLPLYTIWNEGTTGSKALAVLHCTAGDLLIGVPVATDPKVHFRL